MRILKCLLPVVLLFLSVSVFSAEGERVQYKVKGKKYEGYLVGRSTDAPLVVLIHDEDGLTKYEIKRAHMLADKGYAVFAADLYGQGVRPTAAKDKRARTGKLYKKRKKMRRLIEGAYAQAKDLGFNTNNAVLVGYGFGGEAVLEAARSGADFKGFVSFHGGLSTPEGQDYSQITGEVLILHGAADAHISMDDFSSLGKELEEQDVDYEMIAYGGAPHAFTVFGSEGYHKNADTRSWERFLDFLSEVVKK